MSEIRPENPTQELIIARVLMERQKQDAKWGEQNLTDTIWALILGEEFGEAQKEILEAECSYGEEAERHDERLEEELFQLVAVGLSWLESRARRRRREDTPEARERRATANALYGDDLMPDGAA